MEAKRDAKKPHVLWQLEELMITVIHELRHKLNNLQLELADLLELESSSANPSHSDQFQQWQEMLVANSKAARSFRETHSSISGLNDDGVQLGDVRHEELVAQVSEKCPPFRTNKSRKRKVVKAKRGRTTQSAEQLEQIVELLDRLTHKFIHDLSTSLKDFEIEVCTLLKADSSRVSKIIQEILKLIGLFVTTHVLLCGPEMEASFETVRIVDLNDICKDTAGNYRDRRSHRIRSFSFSSAPAEELRLRCRKEWAQMCVYEVLDNAFKFGGEDEAIEIVTRMSGSYFVISVTSHGRFSIGVDEVKECVACGYRGKDVAAYYSGSGTGLWLCDNLMKAQGGNLEVHPTTSEKRTTIDLKFAVSK